MLVNSPISDGTYVGYWGYGMFVFTCAIIVPTLKVLTFSNSFYCLNISMIVLSLATLLLSLVYVDETKSNPHYGMLSKAIFSPNAMIVFLLVIVTTYHMDTLWAKFQDNVFFKGTRPSPSLTREDVQAEILMLKRMREYSTKYESQYSQPLPRTAFKKSTQQKLSAEIKKQSLTKIMTEQKFRKVPQNEDDPDSEMYRQGTRPAGTASRQLPSNMLLESQNSVLPSKPAKPDSKFNFKQPITTQESPVKPRNDLSSRPEEEEGLAIMHNLSSAALVKHQPENEQLLQKAKTKQAQPGEPEVLRHAKTSKPLGLGKKLPNPPSAPLKEAVEPKKVTVKKTKLDSK